MDEEGDCSDGARRGMSKRRRGKETKSKTLGQLTEERYSHDPWSVHSQQKHKRTCVRILAGVASSPQLPFTIPEGCRGVRAEESRANQKGFPGLSFRFPGLVSGGPSQMPQVQDDISPGQEGW